MSQFTHFDRHKISAPRRFQLFCTPAEEGEILKKEKAVVIEKEGALTETQNRRTGKEKQPIEIENIWTRIESLQTRIADLLERTARGADQAINGDQDQGTKHDLLQLDAALASAALAWYSANLFSSSGLKCLIRPRTGQAAPSARAQMVWPSIRLLSSQIMSISAA